MSEISNNCLDDRIEEYELLTKVDTVGAEAFAELTETGPTETTVEAKVAVDVVESTPLEVVVCDS